MDTCFEGKLSVDQLRAALPQLNFRKSSGVLVGPGIGVDAAAIDVELAQHKARDFYQVSPETKW
jgi:hypothetical protein